MLTANTGGRSRPSLISLSARVLLAVVLGALAVVVPQRVAGVAPDVREVTPANIAIDGNAADWTIPAWTSSRRCMRPASPTTLCW